MSNILTVSQIMELMQPKSKTEYDKELFKFKEIVHSLLQGNDESDITAAFADSLLKNDQIIEKNSLIHEGIEYYFKELHYAIKEGIVDRFGEILKYNMWRSYDFNKLKLMSYQEKAKEFLESYELAIEFAFQYFCGNLNFLSVLCEKFKNLNGVKQRL